MWRSVSFIRNLKGGISTAQRLLGSGLSIQGQLWLKTDLCMVNHNPTKIVKNATPIYVWDIKSTLDTPPKTNLEFRSLPSPAVAGS